MMQQAWVRWACICCWLVLVSACSSTPDKPKPAPLPAVTGDFKVQKVWSASIGPVTTPLLASVHGSRVALASTQGQVVLLDDVASTGQTLVNATRQLGLEYFSNWGAASAPLARQRRDETLYAVWDEQIKAHRLQLGLGRPLHPAGGSVDKWVVKIGMNLDID